MTAQRSGRRPPLCGSQGITGPIRVPLTRAEDDMGQAHEPRATRRALETPAGDPTPLDPDIMGEARQAPRRVKIFEMAFHQGERSRKRDSLLG
jgi:hypothetical protein